MTTRAAPPDDPRNALPLTPAQFMILLALAQHDLHGYGIMQSVKERTAGNLKLAPGTLYTALERMIERGWVEETDTHAAGDERRRVYHLTDFGMRVAQAEAQRLEQTVQDARTLGLLGDNA